MKIFIRQTPFFLLDLWKHKGSFLFGLLQISLTLILIGYMFQMAFTYQKTIGEFDTLREQGNIYQIQCIAEAGQIDKAVNSKEGQKNFAQLYDYIERLNNLQAFMANSSRNIYMNESNTRAGELAETQEEGLLSFSTLRISERFFDVFNLHSDTERETINEVFSQYDGKGAIPVVLGHDFKSTYGEGDTFMDDEDQVYQVAGVLKKGELYIAPYESEKAICLDKWMLVPEKAIPLGEGISYITNLVSTCFITDSEDVIKSIIKKASQLNLPPLKYRSLDEQQDIDIADMKNEMLTMGMVMLLIFTFASVGMISYMVRYIQQRKHEFAIHMLCGASQKDVLLRIIMQLCFILLFSNIVVAIVFGWSPEAACTVMVSILYGAGIAAYPTRDFRKHAVIDVIRRNQ